MFFLTIVLSLNSLALPCLALPCLALPCLALPCLALPCLALPCLALPCLALPYCAVHGFIFFFFIPVSLMTLPLTNLLFPASFRLNLLTPLHTSTYSACSCSCPCPAPSILSCYVPLCPTMPPHVLFHSVTPIVSNRTCYEEEWIRRLTDC